MHIKQVVGGLMALVGSVFALTAQAGEMPSNWYEYLETDGNANTAGEYILLDYKPCWTTTVEMVLSVKNTSVTHGLFCARGNSYNEGTFTSFFITINSKPSVRLDYNNATAQWSMPCNDTNVHTVKCSRAGIWIDGVKSTSGSEGTAAFTAANKMMLFASYLCATTATPSATGNYAGIKLYSFKAYDGDNLAVDLYPCKGASGYGLYDNVSGQVYYNKQSGKTFTVGKEISNPIETHANEIQVTTSIPCEGLTLSPALGFNKVASGGSVTCMAPEGAVELSPTNRATVTGWKIYAVDVETGVRTLEREGAGNSVTYTNESGTWHELEWQCTAAYKLSISTTGTGSGTTSYKGEWLTHGETCTITATADEGSDFMGWTGAPEGATVNGTSLSFTLTKSLGLTATFARVRYVAKTGSDANDGSSWDKAYLTILAAINAADDGDEVLVGPGTYTATNTVNTADSAIHALYVAKPITVRSSEGPAVTTIDAGTDKARAEAKIAVDGAVVSGFTFINGLHNTKNRPTGVEASAGVVENCVISTRGQWAHQGFCLKLSGTAKAYDILIAHKSSGGGGEAGSVVYAIGDSVLDGLVLTNFTWTGSAGYYSIWAEGNAQIRNALVADCQMGTASSASMYSHIYLNGSGVRLTDSTIVNNTTLAPTGVVRIQNAGAAIDNCIIWNNTTTSADHSNIYNGANLNRITNTCCSELTDGTSANNTTQDPQFKSLANGDYHLRSISRSATRGAAWLRPTGEAEFECAADASAYQSESGKPLTVTFSGYATEEGVTALWDFGDGTTATDWPSVTHTFETAGAYTVKLTVTKGGESTSYTFEKSFVTTPATCYVKEGATGVYPYDTWEKAAGTLEAAYAVGSRTILVTNGTYMIAAPALGISRAVTIASVEGPEKTILNSPGDKSTSHRHFTISGSDDILVTGFTLVNGATGNYDYGNTASLEMSSGTISNCAIRATLQVSRSGTVYLFGTARAVDCVFDGCGTPVFNGDSDDYCGVRIEGSAMVDRCEILGFSVSVWNDTAPLKGAAPVKINSANAILRNSFVHDCTNGVSTTTRNRGVVALVAGKVQNCTIVNNICGGYGGGLWAKAGSVENSVIYGNTAKNAGNDIYSEFAAPTISASCASDFSYWTAGAGAGCTTKSPNFDTENPYRLTVQSTACLDTGVTADWMADAVDFDHNARIIGDGVDMGAFEFAGSRDVPLGGSVDVSVTKGRAPLTVVIEASLVGSTVGLETTWDLGDGTTTTGVLRVEHTYETAGAYNVSVFVSNSKSESIELAPASPILAVPETCYVSNTGSSEAPYTTWATAATNVADAVALAPDTVLVDDGVYYLSGDGLVVKTETEIRGRHGADKTTLRGTAISIGYNTFSSDRLVWLDNAEAKISDVTLAYGVTATSGDAGVAKITAGTMARCIVTNSVNNYRSPILRIVGSSSKVEDCVIDMKPSGYCNGDGAYYMAVALLDGAIMDRCEVKNAAYIDQGGATAGHKAAVHVVNGSILRNTLVRDCVITQEGNIPNNGVRAGAVVAHGNATVENCTIVNNTVWHDAGLTIVPGDISKSYTTYTPVVRNNICWGNVSTNKTTKTSKIFDVCDITAPKADTGCYLDSPRVDHCCAGNLTAGANGNLASDPLFKRWQGHAYQLSSESPCINAGAILDWMDDDAKDLTGKPRIYKKYPEGNLPDMGCYENNLRGTLLFLR